jgi:hypothetical protein
MHRSEKTLFQSEHTHTTTETLTTPDHPYLFPPLRSTKMMANTFFSTTPLLHFVRAIFAIAILSTTIRHPMAIKITTNKRYYSYNESVIVTWDYEGTTSADLYDVLEVCGPNAPFIRDPNQVILSVYTQTGSRTLPTSGGATNGTVTFGFGPPDESIFGRSWPLSLGDYRMYIYSPGEATADLIASSEVFSVLDVVPTTPAPTAPPSPAPVTSSPTAQPSPAPVTPSPTTQPSPAPIITLSPSTTPSAAPVKVPAPTPVQAPVPTPVQAPAVPTPPTAPTTADTPTASPNDDTTTSRSCGLFGLNFFCPFSSQCGFFKRLFNIGGC